MADIPQPLSQQQILGRMIDAFLARYGIKSLRPGSPILSTLEAASQSDFRSAQEIFQLLNDISLDRAKGLALDRIGADERIQREQEKQASGVVTISDTSFTKKSTRLFPGKPAPIVGSVVLYVDDASSWPASGQLYIGRGTANYEGPLSYTSKTDNGTYWTITLSSATVKYHNTSEIAILAQGGNRIVPAGTACSTPQANVSSAVTFETLNDVTIPDGETAIQKVDVICQKPGLDGNVSANSIKQFPSPPFSGAAVTNPVPYTNGRETQTDDDYREAIRNARATRQKGTELAITSGVTGITATDENRTITSASIVAGLGNDSVLYIDDGTGYEEASAGIPIEIVVDSAIGGEQRFQLTQRPIAKAFVTSQNSAPFALVDGDELTVKVGGVAYTHRFYAQQFININGASAYEVVSSINSNPNIGFSARTTNAGSQIALFAKSDTNEFLEVIPSLDSESNDAFLFPAGVVYTIRLYKNDRLLSKDGQVASLLANPFSQWNSLSGSQTLVISVDGTPEVTYTFTNQDFIDAGTGFITLGKNTINAWIAVINAKIPGISATNENGILKLTSNLGASARSEVSITGGTLVSNRVFRAVTATGRDRDYTLDRNTAQIKLVKALEPGDRLTAGSFNTRAFIESLTIPTTSIATTGNMWFAIDGDAQPVSVGISSGSSITLSVYQVHDWGFQLKIDAGAAGRFSNVHVGDWIILWDSTVSLSATIKGAHRVVQVDPSGAFVIVERRSSAAARQDHRVTALAYVGLNVSKILVTGGYVRQFDPTSGYQPRGVTESCEIFDPNTSITSPCAQMARRRFQHTATLLDNGKVLVVGGAYDDLVNSNGYGLLFHDTTELYDPTSDTWSAGPTLPVAIAGHAAVKLNDGTVAIIGGYNFDNIGNVVPQNTVYIYDPIGNTITNSSVFITARRFAAAQLLADGTVLVAGGNDGTSNLDVVEKYSPSGPTVTTLASMTSTRSRFGLAKYVNISAERILVAGDDDTHTGTYEKYDVATDTWTQASLPFGSTALRPGLVAMTDGSVTLPEAVTAGVMATYSWDPSGESWSSIAAPVRMVDAGQNTGRQFAKILTPNNTLANAFVGVGGVNNHTGIQTAGIAIGQGVNVPLSIMAFTWVYPDAALATNINLPDSGLTVVRTEQLLQHIQITTGSTYTASSFVSALNAQLLGAEAEVYRTNQLRVNTNTFSIDGDIALVAQDVAARGLKLSTSGAIDNLTGHVASVESRSSDIGTPEMLHVFINGELKATASGVANSLVMTQSHQNYSVSSWLLKPDHQVVGLRDYWFGRNATQFHVRQGDNYRYASPIASIVANPTNSARVDVRNAPNRSWKPWSRVMFASPYSITYQDDLSVLFDGDINKRFDVFMSRKLSPVGSTYGMTNAFTDADNSNSSLAAAFGLDYDFSDFAVWMKARTIAFSGDSSRSTLFRFYQPGPNGNGVIVRFSNPDSESQPVKVVNDNLRGQAPIVRIKLASGALRSLALRSSTRVGVAYPTFTGGVATAYVIVGYPISTSARSGGSTCTLVVTLPSGVTHSGLAVGDKIWLQSSDTNMPSGVKTITAIGAYSLGQQPIQYHEAGANGSFGAIGTVSADTTGEVKFSGAGILANDFFRFAEAAPYIDPAFKTSTWTVTAVANQYLTVTTGESSLGLALTTPEWGVLDSASYVKVFANPAQTMTTIAAAVNAAAALPNSTCPIKATVLGSGSGTVIQSTAETLSNLNGGYTLKDGVNWVSSEVQPLNTSQNYQFTFKSAIDGTLSTGADWQNEEVWISPILAKDVVKWLNTPAVSGVFTAGTVELSDNGHRVQISSHTAGLLGSVQIQGGLANSATAAIVGATQSPSSLAVSTIAKTASAGLQAGQWCSIDNTDTIAKKGFGPSAQLTSWSADGLVTLSVPVFSFLCSPTQVRMHFERQGRLVAISDSGILNGGAGLSFASLSKGDHVRLALPASATSGWSAYQIPSQNQGIFRIVRIDYNGGPATGAAGTIWIENDDLVEGTYECVLSGFAYTDLVPGDVLHVNTDFWGADNRGTWVIEKVGVSSAADNNQYQNAYNNVFKVSTSLRAPVPTPSTAALGSAIDPLIRYYEGTPSRLIKKIQNISINPIDGTFVDIQWDERAYYQFMTASAGSIISVIDKLDFPIETVPGADGYRYNTGLIAEANKVIYGDPEDTATYPGIAAANSKVGISGPLVKRVTVSIALRLNSGVPADDVADRVRSAIATYINQVGIGQTIAIGKIVAAAESVVGVVACSIISPTYNATNDIIQVQPYEKPMVLDLTSDIQVSFVGE